MPVGPVKSIPDIIKALQENVAEQKIGKGEWVMGYGYDGTGLAEGREMTRDDLDPALPRQSGDDHPRLEPWRGAEFRGAENVRHHRRYADAGRRPDRPRARLQPAGRSPHGDGVHADLRQGAAAGRGRDARSPEAGAADVCGEGRDHGAGRRDPRRGTDVPPQGRGREPADPRHRLAALHRRGAEDLSGLSEPRAGRQARADRRPLGRVRQLQGPRQARRASSSSSTARPRARPPSGRSRS